MARPRGAGEGRRQLGSLHCSHWGRGTDGCLFRPWSWPPWAGECPPHPHLRPLAGSGLHLDLAIGAGRCPLRRGTWGQQRGLCTCRVCTPCARRCGRPQARTRALEPQPHVLAFRRGSVSLSAGAKPGMGAASLTAWVSPPPQEPEGQPGTRPPQYGPVPGKAGHLE